MFLFNPQDFDPGNLDETSHEIMRKTIRFFEDKGKASIKEDDQKRIWYSEFLEFVLEMPPLFAGECLSLHITLEDHMGIPVAVQKLDTVGVAHCHRRQAPVLGIQEARGKGGAPVVEHDLPPALVRGRDREAVAGYGMEGFEDMAILVQHDLLLALRAPAPGIEAVLAHVAGRQSCFELHPFEEGTVECQEGDRVHLIRHGQVSPWRAADPAGALEIAGPLPLLTERDTQLPVRGEYVHLVLELIHDVKVPGFVLADSRHRAEQEVFPADLEGFPQADLQFLGPHQSSGIQNTQRQQRDQR